MKSRNRAKTRRALRFARTFALVTVVVACGSRTGLLVPEPPEPIGVDAGRDAGLDARDAFMEPDEGEDALPLIDSSPLPDVYRNDCPDAAATLVYLVSETNDLLAFNPADDTYREIGQIACPAPPGDTPFSMAVDRQGVAYVEFSPSGNLFRVSTLTAACIATTFVPDQLGFSGFGMGFASDSNGPDETLYIAGDGMNNSPDALGSISIPNFVVANVGAFNPPILESELTGTGDGRLFAFYTDGLAGSNVGQIDKTNGNVIAASPLPNVDQGTAWAFGFWGGDFYLFTAPDTTSTATRFRPSDGSTTVVATFPYRIVGAGVSTCAPVK
jgi:hypothetical protein